MPISDRCWGTKPSLVLVLILFAMFCEISLANGKNAFEEAGIIDWENWSRRTIPDEILSSEILEKIEKCEPVEYDYAIINGDIDVTKLNHIKSNDTFRITSPIHITNSQINGEINFKEIILKESIDFHNTKFNGQVNFVGCSFNDSDFGSSDFKDSANFGHSKFNESASFDHTLFREGADFAYTAFNGDTSFWQSRFQEYADFRGSNFNKSTDFGASTFEKMAYFSKVNFKETADFKYSDFNGETVFRYSLINGPADFMLARFNRSADFRKNNFNSAAHFDVTKFFGDASFSGSEFKDNSNFRESTFKGFAGFRNSIFDGDASFSSSQFGGDAYFVGSKFYREAVFRNSLFIGSACFNESSFAESADFVGAKFLDVLNLSDAKFDIIDVYWPSINCLICNDGPTYLALIKNFRNLEQYGASDNIYYQYRLWRQGQTSWLEWSKYLDILSWCTCGYGVRWHHTVLSAIFVVILFGIYYSWKEGIFKSGFPERQSKLRELFFFSIIILISAPAEWYWHNFSQEAYKDLTKRYKYSIIFERLIGWSLLILLINTMSRLMIRY
jgi:hypothetical protein